MVRGPGKELSAVEEQLASKVFAVLRQGLIFWEQLQQAGSLSLEAIQADLRGKLDLPRDRRAGDFLGVRFPLVCWLDEIFILDSRWRHEWGNSALEPALYQTRDRAHLFWDQAAQAAARSDADALETFYLCVLLGFRGDLRDKPRELKDKCEQFKREIGLRKQLEWPQMPASRAEPETDIHALLASQRLRWLLLAAALVLSGFLILAGFQAVWQPLGG
jgi:type VI secretion system protein ImpK